MTNERLCDRCRWLRRGLPKSTTSPTVVRLLLTDDANPFLATLFVPLFGRVHAGGKSNHSRVPGHGLHWFLRKAHPHPD